MRFFALVLSLLLMPLALGANASEVARSNERGAAVAPVTESLQSLFGPGPIPRIQHLDAKYKRSGAPRQCRAAWQTLRRRTPSRRPAASTETIVAKAVRAGVPESQIKKTLAVFLANRDSIPNQKFISVIDFNKRSNQKRLFIVNVENGDVKAYHTAAGSGSDRNGNGYATHFSNRSGTHASSLGCSLAAGEYRGSKGRSLMLHGFESSNDNSCGRAVVMHGAGYVGGVPGRSWGCPALKAGDVREVFNKVSGGGLICAYKDGAKAEAGGQKKQKKKRSKNVRRRR